MRCVFISADFVACDGAARPNKRLCGKHANQVHTVWRNWADYRRQRAAERGLVTQAELLDEGEDKLRLFMDRPRWNGCSRAIALHGRPARICLDCGGRFVVGSGDGLCCDECEAKYA